MSSNSSYPRLLLLISRQSTDRDQNHNQEIIQAMIKASDLDDPDIVDGSDLQQKEKRNELFDISGLRAKYPQLFVVEKASSKPKFIGNFETIQGMNESGTFNKKGVLGIDDGSGPRKPTHQPIQNRRRSFTGSNNNNNNNSGGGGGCCIVM